jgi:hypothetical protein
MKLQNGSFFLRRAPNAGGEEEVEGKRWEVIVLLTALALLDMAVRQNQGKGCSN